KELLGEEWSDWGRSIWPWRVDGERAERQRRGAWLGCRGGSGSGLGRVWAWEGAKGRARWRGEVSPGPFGRGRAVDEVHRRRTAGGANRAGRGRERWR